jgi:hypothetical protein
VTTLQFSRTELMPTAKFRVSRDHDCQNSPKMKLNISKVCGHCVPVFIALVINVKLKVKFKIFVSLAQRYLGYENSDISHVIKIAAC